MKKLKYKSSINEPIKSDHEGMGVFNKINKTPNICVLVWDDVGSKKMFEMKTAASG